MTRSGSAAVGRVRADNAVITGVTFKAPEADNLWMFRKVFPYPGKERFSALLKALFLNTSVPSRADVVLDAISGRHDLPLIRITAAGSSAATRTATTALVGAALGGLPAGYAQEIITKDYSGPRVIRAVVEAGTAIPNDPEVDTQRIHRVVQPNEDLSAFLDSVTADVDRGLSFKEDGTGKRDENFRLFARLQLDNQDRPTLSGFIYTPSPVTPAPPAQLASVAAAAPAEVPLHFGPVLPGLFAAPIPDFKGDTYTPSDLLYRWYANQYATSSYPKADMTPFMLAYPRDEADIKAALIFARANQKVIVARSGGHQYCGMSSGGNATIVLAMDAFDQFSKVSTTIFDVGPAVPLTTLASNFSDLEITIPHGECPLVCIGGHAQTGGFGHLLRGFGLALDHVIAFTIVLADGTVRTVQRPAGAVVTDDDLLFWGVLGGNAGSFGIVTNYRFKCIRDIDHPHSYGYARMQKYDKDRYTNLLKIVQDWTREVTAGTLPDDLDFMMTVESESDTLVPPVPTLLVEMVHSNFDGPSQSVNGDQVFQPIIQAAEKDAGIWVIQRARGTKSLSSLSDLFVRRPPFTFNGREFRFPYKKRINCTSSALTDEFLDGFVDLVEKVVTDTDGVYLVFQMLIGGGRFQKSDRRVATSIPRRDFVFTFVFDLFYSDGNEQKAVDLQNEMQNLINAHYSGAQEQRLFWGTFGDPDITKDAVRAYYYDDPAVYARLHQLKKKVDPDDLFHSLLSIKLP
jgi:FAD/FMN-containing dehydrogenase